MAGGKGENGTLLLYQRIMVSKDYKAFVFFDNGSSASLITYKLARHLGLKGTAIRINLITVGNLVQTIHSTLYTVTLIDKRLT